MSVIEDIVRSVRGTKFTRASQPRPAFAVCIEPAARERLISEMELCQRYTSAVRPMLIRELRVDGAVIGRVEA